MHLGTIGQQPPPNTSIKTFMYYIYTFTIFNVLVHVPSLDAIWYFDKEILIELVYSYNCSLVKEKGMKRLLFGLTISSTIFGIAARIVIVKKVNSR